jgi:UDP-N-acetylglucosamine/UDP-N-acetylgalactosamine diphosphorylase
MKAYGIGEVARLLGVKAYIIRYWESELPLLAPRKGLSGRRLYSSAEIQLLLRFKHLLHERKFTVEGAKKRLWEELGGGVPDAGMKIAEIRGDLIDLLMLIQGRSTGEMTERECIERFTALGHEYLFSCWEARPQRMKQRLLEDLELLDLGLLGALKGKLAVKHQPAGPISPAPYVSHVQAQADTEARRLGEVVISGGKTAFLTVAGGQGSRLGFEGPKGMFPISPLRKLTLFAIFAEKLLAARRRYRAEIPWLIMTSPQNHNATVEYFESEGHFGLGRDTVHFFPQGMLPSLAIDGTLLMAEDGGLFFNPNGHGGVVGALRSAGLLTEMRESGVEELFYFQVDNPLVTVPDPVFLGLHRRAGSRISSKVIEKAFPEEKLGTIATLANGRSVVIEYSDLTPELMYAREPDGRLFFPQGSIAVHLLNIDYLLSSELVFPFHHARKRVRALNPCPDAAEIHDREAVKLEMFIFDSIPQADRALFMEADRGREFAPLKNREGVDSIETSIRGQIEKYAAWLTACGIEVPRDERGRSKHAVEISPMFAADAEELSAKRGFLPDRIEGDSLLV